MRRLPLADQNFHREMFYAGLEEKLISYLLPEIPKFDNPSRPTNMIEQKDIIIVPETIPNAWQN